MLKVFLKDSFTYTLGTLLSRGISFLMLPLYAHFFNPKEFGVMDLLLVTGNVLSVVIGLEIHQAVARFFPEAQDGQEKVKLVSTSFWSILTLYVLFLVPGTLLIPQFLTFFGISSQYQSVVLVALISYGFNFLYYFSSSQLRWQLKVKENMYASVIYSALTAVQTYLMLKYLNWGLVSVFVAQAGSAGIVTLFCVYHTKEFYSRILDPAVLRRLLEFSYPLILSTLTVYGMMYADRWIINFFLRTEDVGLFGFAYRISSLVGLLTVGIQSALTPLIYSRYRQPQTSSEIAHLFHLFLGAAGVVLLVLGAGSQAIVEILGSKGFHAAHRLIPWLAAGILFTGAINFTPGIFIEKKTKLILMINGLSFAFNMLLNAVFIRGWGLQGAAHASAASGFLYFFLYYAVGQKYYFIPFFWTRLNPKKMP